MPLLSNLLQMNFSPIMNETTKKMKFFKKYRLSLVDFPISPCFHTRPVTFGPVAEWLKALPC